MIFWRCVHFTECDQDGFIAEDSSQVSQLINVRFGGDDFLCSEEMEVCCQEREIYANDTEAAIQPECPEYFEPWGSKCYHFSPSVAQSGNSVVYLTWNQAKAACERINETASLVMIESREEATFVHSKTLGTIFWLNAYRSYAANYKAKESWKIGGERGLNFTAWAGGQPNNYWWGERCIRSNNERAGASSDTWDDHRCWLRTASSIVCQISLN